MNNVYLLLGSNLDDRMEMLQKAIRAVNAEIGTVTSISSVYESEPWGFNADNTFLNQVVKVETRLSAHEVMENILVIERTLGRQRNSDGGYSSRIIDIDILFFNDEIIQEDKLVIPHPRIAERMFTLLPLFELNQHYLHPGLQKTIRELIIECRDKLQVYPYSSTLQS